jgi:hypothetical protein
MAHIIFTNAMNKTLYLHMRIGPVDIHPDDRGTTNATVAAGDIVDENVGDGDIWYAYGGQPIGGDENPQLCQANGGDTVNLDGTQPCYVG